jgi:hypothetical protein
MSGALLPSVPALPADGVLLHIGVHKTGTTAIQAALADARPELKQHHVTYPGKLQAQHRAALAVLGRHWGWNTRGGSVLDRAHFEKLAKRVRANTDRIAISSEFFCEADEATSAEVVRELGTDRAHVVITLRNLGKLLPSSWQQYLKYGLTTPYDTWLEDVFATPGSSKMSPTFWRRHDHAAVVRRWTEAVGADRVTVLILENVDRRAMFVTFAQLLGVPEEILTQRMDLTSNRSMTAAEAEVLRRLNQRVKKSMQWEEYVRYVRRGVALGMVEGRKPESDEAALITPEWALDAAAVQGNQFADAIDELGVRVLGDLDALRVRTSNPESAAASPTEIPIDAAVQAVTTVIEAAREDPTAKELTKSLAKRIKRDLRRSSKPKS